MTEESQGYLIYNLKNAMVQVVQKNFNYLEAIKTNGQSGVGVLVRHSRQTSIAAVEHSLIQIHASLPIIQPFSRRLVQELIAMPLMMAPALSLAKQTNMILFSVPTAMGIHYTSSHSNLINFFSLSIYCQFSILSRK